MKIVLGLILALSIFEVYANEIKVRKMTRDGDLDRSFILKTNLQEKVVIDCQSFIQGLRIGEYEDAHTYMLDPDACEGLQVRVKDSLKKRKSHCILVEEDISSDYECN